MKGQNEHARGKIRAERFAHQINFFQILAADRQDVAYNFVEKLLRNPVLARQTVAAGKRRKLRISVNAFLRQLRRPFPVPVKTFFFPFETKISAQHLNALLYEILIFHCGVDKFDAFFVVSAQKHTAFYIIPHAGGGTGQLLDYALAQPFRVGVSAQPAQILNQVVILVRDKGTICLFPLLHAQSGLEEILFALACVSISCAGIYVFFHFLHGGKAILSQFGRLLLVAQNNVCHSERFKAHTQRRVRRGAGKYFVKLYFEPLTPEDVESIVKLEKPDGAVVQFGGQTAIKLTESLMKMGVKILGTKAEDVDAAEDRELFDKILEETEIPRAAGGTVFTAEEAKEVANRLGYPVLVRPSYVLGGQGMQIALNDEEIEEFMAVINRYAQDHPILVDKYLQGKEIEVDAVCDGTDILIPGIMEHIESCLLYTSDAADD